MPRKTTPPGTDPGAPAGFFDDDYRRLLEPFHPEAEARRETGALRELLALAQEERILDLGCGWGRHLALLAAAGHDVTGVDLSPSLLRQARLAVAAEVGRSHPGPPADPRLVAADMRALPLRDGTFDAVLNVATSFGLFLEDPPALAALREVRRVLRPGGRFLVEGMHRDDVVARFAPRDRWRLADGTEVRARRVFDPVRGVSREVLRWRGPAGAGEKRHALRIRSATELVGLVEAAGLVVAEALGGWGSEPFGRDSPRLILIAGR